MRKSLLAVISVAILAGLSIFINKNNASNSLITSTSSSSNQPSVPTDNSTTSNISPVFDSSTGYKDGTYTGSATDTIYGTVQVAAVINGGKISDIKFLRMPNDHGHSQEVTAAAEPSLKSQTLAKQSAHIDFVSGATQTSEGYEQSLQAALDKAATS